MFPTAASQQARQLPSSPLRNFTLDAGIRTMVCMINGCLENNLQAVSTPALGHKPFSPFFELHEPRGPEGNFPWRLFPTKLFNCLI